jgi:hypothetical protein
VEEFRPVSLNIKGTISRKPKTNFLTSINNDETAQHWISPLTFHLGFHCPSSFRLPFFGLAPLGFPVAFCRRWRFDSLIERSPTLTTFALYYLWT